MSEIRIGTSYKATETAEAVSIDRVSLIGCIGVWSNRLKRFPLPLLALDGQPQITSFDKVTRVDGLLPSDWDDDYLMRGSWTGQVDIPGSRPHGEGSVYLGNANTPSDTYGVVFEEALPYDPALELCYVAEAGGQTILHERQYDDVTALLIYADATVLDGLHRMHQWQE